MPDSPDQVSERESSSTPNSAPASHTRIDWLGPARDGNIEALGHLLELCRHYLLKVANQEMESRLLAKAGASDLVQDAFLEAQRIFHRFQGQGMEEFLAWLRAILLNKVEDSARLYQGTQKRDIQREVSLVDPSVGGAPGHPVNLEDSTPSQALVRAERDEAIHLALAKLPEHYRQILTWRHWDDLTFEEIGRRLGKSADASRMMWGRAVARFESEMSREIEVSNE